VVWTYKTSANLCSLYCLDDEILSVGSAQVIVNEFGWFMGGGAVALDHGHYNVLLGIERLLDSGTRQDRFYAALRERRFGW
jgi:hypothetical protein